MEVREVQIPLLSAMLLGGGAPKFAGMLRVGSVDAGLGPTARSPARLRRPVATGMCAGELACGVALLVTADGLGRGEPANTVRLATSVLFLVATCALIELRTSHPEVGCGCFGDFSTSPVSWRTMTRSALLSAAALATIGLPPLRPPHPGAEAGRLLAILAVELAGIAALSPELGEALARFGYSEPCEPRRVAAGRALAAPPRRSPGRRRSAAICRSLAISRRGCRRGKNPAEALAARPARSWGEPGPGQAGGPQAGRTSSRQDLRQAGALRQACWASGRLGPEEAAEVRHGEGDQPALRAVDQALLNQAVPRRGDAGRLAAQFLGHLRRRHRLVPPPPHPPHALRLPPGPAVVPP